VTTPVVKFGALDVVAIALAPPARADLIFAIGGNFSGAGTPAASYDTVKLVDGTRTRAGENGVGVGTVAVTETLSPNFFAKSGASDTREFSLPGSPSSVTFSGVVFTGNGVTPSSAYTLDKNPAKPNGAGGKGSGWDINCSACGNGTKSPARDPSDDNAPGGIGGHAGG
jgi:hypothetical protein